MRDFLFSEIAAVHGLANVPDDPALAIAAGTRLCEDLLEPLQDRFGRIVVRSGFRSAALNAFGNQKQREGKAGYNCARNAVTYANHIWDRRDAAGHMGATACIVIPRFIDAFPGAGEWTKLAWWIHDHLPYSSLQFFPVYWAVNITWNEKPVRRIDSYVAPRGCLTRPGMDNFDGSHQAAWAGIEKVFL